MNSGGFFKIWRKIKEHPLFESDHDARHFFFDLLGDVAFKETVQDWRGRPIVVPRGSVMVSQRGMAKRYGFSHQKVRTMISRLENHKVVKINTLPNKGPTLLSICNWDKYQQRQHTVNTPVNTEPTHCQHTKEEGEEVKKKEEEKKQAKKDRPQNSSDRKTGKRGSRLPIDWVLVKSWGDEAKKIRPDLTDSQIRNIADEFKDHFIAAPGQKGVKIDWLATWRNWIRRQDQFGGSRASKQCQQFKTREELANERWLEKTTEQYRNAAPAVAADDDPYGMADVAAELMAKC